MRPKVSSSSQPRPSEVESCPLGKRPYSSYGEALGALIDLDRRERRESRGSVYECRVCGKWHLCKRLFTVNKPRGRGRRRRGVMHG